MAWLETLLDWASTPTGSAVTGAVAGAAVGAATGSDNIWRDAAVGGALGYGGNYLYNNGVPDFASSFGSAGESGGSPGLSTGTSFDVGANLPTYDSSGFAFDPGTASVNNFSVDAADSGNFGNYGGGAGYFDTATQSQPGLLAKIDSGLTGFQNNVADSKSVELGSKLIPAIVGLSNSGKQADAMDAYQRNVGLAQESQRIANERTNQAREDVYSDQRTQVAGAGLRASNAVNAQTAGTIDTISKNSKLDETAKAALGQKARVAGASGAAGAFSVADQNARKGVSAPTYAGLSTPSFDSGYMNNLSNQNKDLTAGVAKFYDDVTGLSTNKAKKQIGNTVV